MRREWDFHPVEKNLEGIGDVLRDLLLTAGVIDTHIHFICPQQIEHAIASGVPTLIGGGTGPAHGNYATTFTPGK